MRNSRPPAESENAERVGVAVRRDRAVAERPGVGDDADLAGRVEVAAEHEVAAFGKGLPDRQARRAGVERFELGVGARAEQPARLVVERARLLPEVAAAEEQRAGGEQRLVRAEALLRREAHREAVVRVAEHRHVAAGVHDRGQVVEHRFEARLVVGGEPLPIGLAGQQAQQLEVEHELLVGDRLLAVHAVGRVLHQRLALEDRFRGLAPALRRRPARPGERRDEQARGLADEMVVGRRMQREPAADELRVLVDRVQPAAAEGRFLLEDLRPEQLPGGRPVDEAQRRLPARSTSWGRSRTGRRGTSCRGARRWCRSTPSCRRARSPARA